MPRRRSGVLLPALPLVAKRRQICGDIIAGILGMVGGSRAVVAIAVSGVLPGESYLIVIPIFVIALLLIESSMSIRQEG